MIRIYCDKCNLLISEGSAFKICKINQGEIKDEGIICSDCMGEIAKKILSDKALSFEVEVRCEKCGRVVLDSSWKRCPYCGRRFGR